VSVLHSSNRSKVSTTASPQDTRALAYARQQRAGGVAALYIAAAYLVVMPYFLIVSDYKDLVDPAQKVTSLVARAVRHLDPRDVRLSGLEHCYRTMRRACASVAAGLLGSSAEQGTLVPDQRPFPRSTLTLTGLLFGHLVRPTAHSRRDAPGSQKRVLPSTRGGNDARSTYQ